jgi:hypothetical protein
VEITHTINESNYSFTDHARRRAQQRGIKLDTIKFILRHADIRLHAGEGSKSLRISQREFVRLAQDGATASLVDRSRSVVVVVNPHEMTVVTVLHDHGSSAGRCYRSQWPTRSEKSRRLRRSRAAGHFADFDETDVKPSDHHVDQTRSLAR